MFPCHGISDGSCPYFDRVSHLFSFIYFCGIFSSSIIYYQVLFTTISVQVRAFVVNDLTTENHTGLMDTILFSYSLVVLISQSINPNHLSYFCSSVTNLSTNSIWRFGHDSLVLHWRPPRFTDRCRVLGFTADFSIFPFFSFMI